MGDQEKRDTPWVAEYDGHGGVSLETKDGTQIACLKGSKKDYADRIAHCINCHVELLEALEEMCDLTHTPTAKARAAIEKAKAA